VLSAEHSQTVLRVGGYFYSIDDQGIFVKHYGASEARIPFGAGVNLVQRTDFPWNGDINLQVTPTRPVHFTLRLRIPSWAKSHVLRVNGKSVDAPTKRGWVTLRREWRQGDSVDLSLSMNIERVTMPERFKDYLNLVALQRGPIVYCQEEDDMTATALSSYQYLPSDAELIAEHRPSFLGGVTVLRADLRQINNEGTEPRGALDFIPYGVWSNRTQAQCAFGLTPRHYRPRVRWMRCSQTTLRDRHD